MTRAVVLGGGGPVGIGWEAGLLVGLANCGVDIGLADAIIGTSAGSAVGLTLAAGEDLSETVARLGGAGGAVAGDAALAEAAPVMEQLIASVAEAAGNPDGADSVRARLGRVALDASTISEDLFVGMFDLFAGVEWPERFFCTAVDASSGRFKVWGPGDGVDPARAVASSCAVPGIFPPVTIGGCRWMDGGVRDMVNADVAAGHQTVLAVSCTVLELPEGLSVPVMNTVWAATRAQLAGLSAAGSKVEVILPGAEMLEVSEWGLNLMDFSRGAAAYEAGVRQGEEEAARLAGFWAG